MHDAQLVEHPVVLPPFVVMDLFNAVGSEHDKRVEEGIYEPLVEGGRDIVHALQEKIALALPTTTNGADMTIPFNTPEINTIRELLAAQQAKNNARDIVEETECEQDILAFEAAVAESAARSEQDEKRLGMKDDTILRRFNVRTSGAIPLQWALSAFIAEEKEYMRPKSSSEFDNNLEIGERTLRAFQKGRKFDVDPATGKSRLTQVVLSGQQIDYLLKNLQNLKSGMGTDLLYRKLLDDLVNGLRYSYPMAQAIDVREGFLKKMVKRITGQDS